MFMLIDCEIMFQQRIRYKRSELCSRDTDMNCNRIKPTTYVVYDELIDFRKFHSQSSPCKLIDQSLTFSIVVLRSALSRKARKMIHFERVSVDKLPIIIQHSSRDFHFAFIRRRWNSEFAAQIAASMERFHVVKRMNGHLSSIVAHRRELTTAHREPSTVQRQAQSLRLNFPFTRNPTASPSHSMSNRKLPSISPAHINIDCPFYGLRARIDGQ